MAILSPVYGKIKTAQSEVINRFIGSFVENIYEKFNYEKTIIFVTSGEKMLKEIRRHFIIPWRAAWNVDDQWRGVWDAQALFFP